MSDQIARGCSSAIDRLNDVSDSAFVIKHHTDVLLQRHIRFGSTMTKKKASKTTYASTPRYELELRAASLSQELQEIKRAIAPHTRVTPQIRAGAAALLALDFSVLGTL